MHLIQRWLSENIVALGRDMRWSYLPPLMVYVAAGIQGLTGIVGTFFVKDYLGLSAEFLAALGFWAFVPWSLKMPLGHLVDLIWRFKAWLVVLGAVLIACSLVIMAALIGHREAMAALWSVNAWFVLATLLSPIGYVLQDVVADAMTVEAVPMVNAQGNATPPDQLKRMHITMQTLGRVAFLNNRGAVSIYAGLYFQQGFTYNRRTINFDQPDITVSTARRLDLKTGFRVGWYIPFYSAEPREYYYN